VAKALALGAGVVEGAELSTADRQHVVNAYDGEIRSMDEGFEKPPGRVTALLHLLSHTSRATSRMKRP
jgi:hypothetical protein